MMENSNSKKWKYIIPFSILYLITAICMFKAEFLWSYHEHDVDFSKTYSKISAEDYQKIRIGMTYGKVCEILGSKGEKYINGGPAFTGRTYYIWSGDLGKSNPISSYAKIGFSNEGRRVESIYENNLINGREVLDNKNNKKTSKIELVYAELPGKVKKDMTYEEVVKVLGSEGVLTDSDSQISDHADAAVKKTYSWDCLYDSASKSPEHTVRVYFVDNKVDYVF